MLGLRSRYIAKPDVRDDRLLRTSSEVFILRFVEMCLPTKIMPSNIRASLDGSGTAATSLGVSLSWLKEPRNPRPV